MFDQLFVGDDTLALLNDELEDIADRTGPALMRYIAEQKGKQ